ncbi:hypothetical protein BIW11_04058 [Tropilaelaps mercedesae]|uniref:Uncharacterized protein n=1 Tax=Tropilaelaps mercedesae TaxID=418985 RepID=A0A1V9XBR9_9ACAR|nr:hypothetical protein BIW11_04058 [Tropilaelaps mercedesae]
MEWIKLAVEWMKKRRPNGRAGAVSVRDVWISRR